MARSGKIFGRPGWPTCQGMDLFFFCIYLKISEKNRKKIVEKTFFGSTCKNENCRKNENCTKSENCTKMKITKTNETFRQE